MPLSPLNLCCSLLAHPQDLQLPPLAKAARLRAFLLHVLITLAVFSAGILFLGVAILFLVHLFIISGALRTPTDGDDNEDHPSSVFSSSSSTSHRGLSPRDLERLPCFDSEGGCSSDCAVCLEAFQPGDRCRFLLHCKHSFHTRCIDPWLTSVPLCPLCRSAVRPPD